MHDMAEKLGEQGKLEETMAMFEEALRMTKKVHGAEHAHVADTLTRMAIVLQLQGKLEEAVAMLEEALRVQKKVYGAVTQYSMALVLKRQEGVSRGWWSIGRDGSMPPATRSVRSAPRAR